MDLVISGLDCVADRARQRAAWCWRRRTPFAPTAPTCPAWRWRVRTRSRSPSTPRAEEAAQRQAAQPFFVPFHEGNCPIPNGNMLRKVQCDFGWDWNIALAPFGLYGRRPARAAGRARAVERIAVRQDHRDGHVTLTVDAEVLAPPGTQVTFAFAGEEVTGTVAGRTVSALFEVGGPGAVVAGRPWARRRCTT